MAPPLKMISIVWRIIEPSMIFLSKREQSMLYFTPIACTDDNLWKNMLCCVYILTYAMFYAASSY